MEINATLLGQMITFVIFIWFTMRVVWPLIDGPLEERKKRIADGLAQAEQGQKILQDAQLQAQEAIEKSRVESQSLLADANAEANRILEAARAAARKERDAILAAGHTSLDLALAKAKADLQADIANIVVLGAEKILARSINPDDHKELLDSLAKNL